MQMKRHIHSNITTRWKRNRRILDGCAILFLISAVTCIKIVEVTPCQVRWWGILDNCIPDRDCTEDTYGVIFHKSWRATVFTFTISGGILIYHCFFGGKRMYQQWISQIDLHFPIRKAYYTITKAGHLEIQDFMETWKIAAEVVAKNCDMHMNRNMRILQRKIIVWIRLYVKITKAYDRYRMYYLQCRYQWAAAKKGPLWFDTDDAAGGTATAQCLLWMRCFPKLQGIL